MVQAQSRISALGAAAAIAVCVLISGCGYHFASSGANLPPSAKTIYVARFGNRTRFTGLNDQFMRFVKDEIANHKRLQMVDSPTGADLELSGDILNLFSTPIAFNSVLEPTIYNQTMAVHASLKDLKTHRTLWSGRLYNPLQDQAPVVSQSVVSTTPTFQQQNLRANDIAKMTDIQVAQTQTQAATDLMMSQIAHNLYTSMAEGF
ncbi:MAG TPA: LPS assembly lipoprotein LptE [Candidatus Binataceae bacterium]